MPGSRPELPAANGAAGDDGSESDSPAAGAASSDSEGGSDASGAGEAWVVSERGWAARALAALNALRKARQHYDVVLCGDGEGEVWAHRAVLAAAAPALPLPAGPGPHRVEGVPAAALAALVEFAYSGRLAARSAAEARALYAAAWTLRMEAARGPLLALLLRRVRPRDALALLALPALGAARGALHAYCGAQLPALAACGALRSLPHVRVEAARESSAAGGEESAAAVAAAALDWLRAALADNGDDLEALCARSHLLYVDAGGALRDCGALPSAAGQHAALGQYRAAAAARAPAPAPAAPAPATPAPAAPAPAPGGDEDEWRVLGAGADGAGGTRGLLALGRRLVVAAVRWRALGAVPRGAPLAQGGGEPLGAMAQPRCGHGAAALGGTLLVCGGYDRARALRSVEQYCPRAGAWRAAPELRVARARCAAAALRGAVFAAGGSDGHAELDSLEALGADGSREARARLPLALSHAAAAADEARGVLWVVGGWAGAAPLRLVHEYDAERDAWSAAPPLAAERSQCAAVVWRGALWALGGCDQWHCLSSTERLPLAGAGAGGAGWEPGPALPTARRSMGGAAWRGALLSAGGSDGAASVRRTEVLEAADGAWRAGPALLAARAGPALAVLGEALFAVGGFDGKQFLGSVECLHELDGRWTALRDAPPPSPPLSDKLQALALDAAERAEPAEPAPA